MSKPKVLVAGATGYLGKYVVKALHREGYSVRALARSEAKLAEVRDCCDEVVVAEATDASTLEGLVGDATVVFSSLGKRDFKRKPTVWDIDYRGNLNILERARQARVEHFVFISAVNADKLAQQGGDMARAREGVVDAIKQSGMQWTILRPTGFFNDMADMFKMAINGTGWLIGDGSFALNPIHGADLAEACVRCIGDPEARDKEIDVGGPDVLTQREITELAFAALGKTPKLRSVPTWVVGASASVVKVFNPMVGGIMQAIHQMSKMGAVAPATGTHHLKDFYAELVQKERAQG